MTAVASDPDLDRLTEEQLTAAGSSLPRLFLQAAPGSGKTTVAAQRFGARRYSSVQPLSDQVDGRAVLAVSFTRSATRELRGRVQRTWGSTALRWPHRIVTLDTVVCELLGHLLARGLVRWPGGHTILEVHDSWKVLVPHAFTRAVADLTLVGDKVKVRVRRTRVGAPNRREPAPFEEVVESGVCTHEDVRRVLELSLARPDVVTGLQEHLAATVRSLIVDEVFDANELDIRVIELALAAGIEITIIGDPWQALYGFRGARPDLVPDLLVSAGLTTLSLTQSFRWRTDEQHNLATTLRSGSGVELPEVVGGDLRAAGADAVLATEWKDLWSTGDAVLPLAWGAARGNIPEAATTLLLNQVTSTALGMRATYLPDALATLRITDPTTPRHLDPLLRHVLELVAAASSKAEWTAAYDALVDTIRKVSAVPLPRAHANYIKRLKDVQVRLTLGARVIPGMTVHQAKGREWGTVVLRLKASEVAQLQAGLTKDLEKHRQLYVGCTRARDRVLRM